MIGLRLKVLLKVPLTLIEQLSCRRNSDIVCADIIVSVTTGDDESIVRAGRDGADGIIGAAFFFVTTATVSPIDVGGTGGGERAARIAIAKGCQSEVGDLLVLRSGRRDRRSRERCVIDDSGRIDGGVTAGGVGGSNLRGVFASLGIGV